MIAHYVQAVVATSDANAPAQHEREAMKAWREMAKWVGLAW